MLIHNVKLFSNHTTIDRLKLTDLYFKCTNTVIYENFQNEFYIIKKINAVYRGSIVSNTIIKSKY